MNDKRLNLIALYALLVPAVLMSGCVGMSYSALVNVEDVMVKNLNEHRKIEVVTEKEIDIVTTPPDASVSMGGNLLGKTPITIKYPLRGNAPEIKIFLDGYEPVAFLPEKKRLYKYDSARPSEVAEIINQTLVGTIMLTPWLGADYIQWREELDCEFSPKKYNIQLIEQ